MRPEMRYATHQEPSLGQRLSARLYTLIFRRDPDFMEVLSGVLMAAWGLQLLLPWQTFAAGNQTFLVLAGIWPHTEAGWGGLFCLIGVLKLAGYFSGCLPLRLAASLLVSSGWAFLAGAFGYANPAGTGVIMYAGASIGSSWVLVRLLLAARTQT